MSKEETFFDRLNRGEKISCTAHDEILGGKNPCAIVENLYKQLAELEAKYDNLYKCYQKTSREDLKDKYNLAEENERLKAENEKLKETNRILSVEITKSNLLKQDQLYTFCGFAIPEIEKLKSLMTINNVTKIEDLFICYACYKHMEQQLKEKDKEIKRLKIIVDTVDKLKQVSDKTTNFIILDVDTYTREYAKKIQSNTKQVCEKIKKGFKCIEKSIDNDLCSFGVDYKTELKQKAFYKNAYKIIDKAEKGENNVGFSDRGT